MPKSNPLKQSILCYTPAIGWGIFMTVYTLLPQESLPQKLLNFNDKLLHAGIYFLLTSLIYLGKQRYNPSNSLSSGYLWIIFFAGLLHGGLIELLQHYCVTNRHGEWLDFGANGLGALIALFTFKNLAHS